MSPALYKRTKTYDTNNPRYDRYSGCVYTHVLVAEKILGRYLNKNETVHHIDENKNNNNPDNLMIFASISEHNIFHSGEYKELVCKNKIWRCIKGDRHCVKCNKILKHKSKNSLCRTCYNEHGFNHKVKNRPSREELYEKLKKNSFVEVGRMYRVSDNAVRKWCKKYDIPHHSSYYKRFCESN